MSEVTPPLVHNHCVIWQQPQRRGRGGEEGERGGERLGGREKKTDRHRGVDE